jgi:hypothetical protein
MSERKEALQDLLAKIEAGGVIEYLDTLTMVRSWRSPLAYSNITEYIEGACNGSLDAAKSLHDAVLPDWAWSTAIDAHNERWFVVGDNVDYETDEIYHIIPSRAWLIAIIKALIAQEGE